MSNSESGVPLNVRFKNIIENVIVGLRNENLKVKVKNVNEEAGSSLVEKEVLEKKDDNIAVNTNDVLVHNKDMLIFQVLNLNPFLMW